LRYGVKKPSAGHQGGAQRVQHVGLDAPRIDLDDRDRADGNRRRLFDRDRRHESDKPRSFLVTAVGDRRRPDVPDLHEGTLAQRVPAPFRADGAYTATLAAAASMSGIEIARRAAGPSAARSAQTAAGSASSPPDAAAGFLRSQCLDRPGIW